MRFNIFKLKKRTHSSIITVLQTFFLFQSIGINLYVKGEKVNPIACQLNSLVAATIKYAFVFAIVKFNIFYASGERFDSYAIILSR